MSKAEIGRILDQIEKELTKKPDSYPLLKGRFTGLRKFRIGDYSVIYAFVGTDILVLRIGNRRDIYKGKI